MGDSVPRSPGRWPAGSPSTDSGAYTSEQFDSELDGQESFISIQAEQLQEQAPVRHSAQRMVPKFITNVDPFANINSCTPEHIEKLATILEIRGAQPRQTKMREACFNAAGLKKGMSVLEIGCGTGVVTRELARIAGRDRLPHW